MKYKSIMDTKIILDNESSNLSKILLLHTIQVQIILVTTI
jgi:hypothetical protein